MSSTADIVNDHQNNPEVSDILEERLIDAEYKIWKKNSPYLYDFVMTHSLEWPSLTCQWLPHTKTLEKSIEHNLLLGTHTTGEQNYLMVASVNLAKDDDVVVETNDGNEEDQGQASNVPTITAANYEEEKGEVGGFGHASSSSIGKIEIRMKIKHDGEVNRARYMPQNHFIVASRGPNPEIYIWDLSKHSSFPDEASVPAPQGVCIGHKAEGYGMCWSNHQEGRFITCSDDKTVALWDVNSVINAKVSSASGTQIKPLSIFSGHTAVVEDVDWHRRDVNLIGSVGDDRAIRIWDVRKNNPNDSEHVIHKAHEADINSIAFNPINEFLLATGSSDKTVALWDMRNLKCRIQTLRGHTNEVFNVEWAPFNESILASCSSDRRVGVWDLSRIGMEQSEEDAEDGPPELLFLHGGHTSKVSDFSFNPNNDWTLASVSEDNVLQVWHMAEEIYADEGDDSDDEDEDGNDGKIDKDALADDELE